MNKHRLLILCILAFISALCLPSRLEAINTDKLEYGLRIKSYPLSKSELTSFDLDCGVPFSTGGRNFKLSFSLKTRPENVFGTIFRIITEKGDNIDLMYTIDRKGEHYPMLVTGEQIWIIPSSITMDQWVDVSAELNPKTGEIILNYDKSTFKVKDAGTKNAKKLRISFGLCDFEGYRLDDVASVDVKDICVEKDGKPIRKWLMSLHDGDICYDELAHIAAKGTNCQWLIDRYITWEPLWTGTFRNEPSVAFNPDGKFYIYDGEGPIITYDIAAPEGAGESRLAVRQGHSPANAPGLLLYLPQHKKLLSYNLDDEMFSQFDEARGAWTFDQDRKPQKDCDYYNKTTALHPSEQIFYSFGGYGHYYFKNNLIVCSPHGQCTNIVLDDITPRYGSSSIVKDSLLYIFGGRGNLSGKQELSPRYYYDLYTVDLKTFKVTKEWEFEGRPETGDFLPGENMFYNAADDSFYTLCNKDGGTLLRISRTAPEFEIMSLPTLGGGNFQYLNNSLFHSEGCSKIYAARITSKVNKESEVTIMQMNFPAIPAALLHQSPELPESMRHSKFLTIALIILVVLGAGVTGYLVAYHRKREEKQENLIEAFTQDTKHYDFGKNSICLFGGFKVMDKDGNNITAQFTPTLKYLIVLLILHSDVSHTGISSSNLNKILWYYKPDESANNNRNVFISKLRTILEQMNGVSIINKNKLWSIEFSDGASCDYLEAMRIFKESRNADVNKLIELLLYGVMLPNTEVDWLDSFKGDFSNKAIDFLTRQFSRTDVPDDVLIRTADTIFMHDFLNKDALINKCKILCRQGKSGMARSCYDNYCREYKDAMTESFDMSFKEIIA